MRIPSATGRRRARIEIIPLIDIVFFLLATFVMVSLSMVKNQGIAVHLPRASTGSGEEAGGKGRFAMVTLTSTGEVYVDKERVRLSDVGDRLRRIHDQDKNLTLVLNGDEKALLGKAIFVLDEARKIGIKKLAIETRQP